MNKEKAIWVYFGPTQIHLRVNDGKVLYTSYIVFINDSKVDIVALTKLFDEIDGYISLGYRYIGVNY